jgi:predicted enzyme related to lactoylglutathione lyase
MSGRQLTDPAGAGNQPGPRPVVHLELHTCELAKARQFYRALLGWQPDEVWTKHGSYLALGLGDIDGGMVECGTERPLWIPYAEVERIDLAANHARALGARVLLEPREGPAGWRTVIATDHGGEIALWQRKEAR